MPLINCKVELKLKWTKYCVSTAPGNIININSNNIIFNIKDTKLHVPVINLSARDNQKMKMKIQINLDIFSNQILLELIYCFSL